MNVCRIRQNLIQRWTVFLVIIPPSSVRVVNCNLKAEFIKTNCLQRVEKSLDLGQAGARDQNVAATSKAHNPGTCHNHDDILVRTRIVDNLVMSSRLARETPSVVISLNLVSEL